MKGFRWYVQHFIDKPTIAAVNGAALSAVQNWRWPAIWWSPFRTPSSACPGQARPDRGCRGVPHRRTVARKAALEMLFTGEPITADDALKWG